MGGVVVAYDDYEVVTGWTPRRVISWLDNGATFEGAIAPGLFESLVSQDGLVFLEAPFGRACPDDVALARKIAALAKIDLGNNGFSDIFWVGWMRMRRLRAAHLLCSARGSNRPQNCVFLRWPSQTRFCQE